jgi:aspartyl protease family protein
VRLAFYLLLLGGGLAAVLLLAGSGVEGVGGVATDDLARLVFFGTLALAIGSAVLRRRDGSLGDMVGAGLFWLIVLIVLAVGYGYRDDLSALGGRTIGMLVPGQPMETGRRGEAAVARSRDGHFHVVADVDGARVRFMIDTGASAVVLTDDDARAAGLDPDRLIFDLDVSTANGRAKAAEVRLGAIRIGDIEVRNVRAMVARPGQLETSLLGNTFLSRLASFTVEGRRLTMRQ